MTATGNAVAHHADVGDALATLAARVRAVTVEISSRDGIGNGSGVIWDGGGLVITNAHVARGRDSVITLAGGGTFDAILVASDPARDLAALRVDATELPTALIGDSNRLRTGELVLALGNPLGIPGAAALGIVYHPAACGPRGGRWIAADVQLAPGSSGGPLADAAGRVIGINTLIAFGLALAVPSRAVMRFLQRVRDVSPQPAWSAS
ncbi:MAG TPA: trypsin-like peptidase domain-containing protein [Gemmatimonadaceae bacterium]|jgi:serine protease Do|nr:trypsin-like peptidase domain-containing protein [Gemmatimonadaceae bacterium]